MRFSPCTYVQQKTSLKRRQGSTSRMSPTCRVLQIYKCHCAAIHRSLCFTITAVRFRLFNARWLTLDIVMVVQSRFAETLTLTLNPNFGESGFGESGRHHHGSVKRTAAFQPGLRNIFRISLVAFHQ